MFLYLLHVFLVVFALAKLILLWSFWPSPVVIILFVFSCTCRGPAWLGFVILLFLIFLFYLSFFDLAFFLWSCFFIFPFFVFSVLAFTSFLGSFPFSFFPSFFCCSLFLSRTSLCFISVYSSHTLVYYLCDCNNKSFCYFIYPAPLL